MTVPTEPQTAPAPTFIPAPSPVTAPPVNPDQMFTIDQVNAAREAARKEANDRLYPRLEQQDERYKSLMQEVESLKSVNQQAQEAEQARLAEIENARTAAENADKSAKELLEQESRKWEEQFAQLKRDNEVKDALLQKERERSELVAYRDQRIRDEQEPKYNEQGQQISDGIAPQLVGYIDGATKEEIDRAIITAQQNTTSILEGIRAAQTARAASAPGVSVNAGITPDMNQTPGTREYTAAEIAQMPLNSPELQQLRQQHGIGRATPQHGMFG